MKGKNTLKISLGPLVGEASGATAVLCLAGIALLVVILML